MRKFMTFVYIICLSIIFTPTCYAYIDPAATSYVIQVGAGIVIAVGTIIGIFWSKIKRVFKKKDNTSDSKVDTAAIKQRSEEMDRVTADDLLDN